MLLVWVIGAATFGVVSFVTAADQEGTDGPDQLQGTDMAEKIDGGHGDDQIQGQGGNDSLNGGPDSDVVDGGAGDDTIHGASCDVGEFGRLLRQPRQRGPSGRRRRRHRARQLVRAQDLHRRPEHRARERARRWRRATTGSSPPTRATGCSAARATTACSACSATTSASAGPGNDELAGGEGSDQLAGEDGVDRLHGDADNDGLTGGAGADTLNGGRGADRLEGGDGADDLEGRGRQRRARRRRRAGPHLQGRRRARPHRGSRRRPRSDPLRARPRRRDRRPHRSGQGMRTPQEKTVRRRTRLRTTGSCARFRMPVHGRSSDVQRVVRRGNTTGAGVPWTAGANQRRWTLTVAMFIVGATLAVLLGTSRGAKAQRHAAAHAGAELRRRRHHLAPLRVRRQGPVREASSTRSRAGLPRPSSAIPATAGG